MSRVTSSSGSKHAMATGDQQPLVKRRRGRQPRPCTLSGPVRDAARAFAAAVGAPRVIEPAGFRDFVGWLQLLSSPFAADAWSRLLTAVVADCGGAPDRIAAVQPDVVREIIANVITIRTGESSKLVSTNARRQSTRPEQGLTLMKIFDTALAQHAVRGSRAPAGGGSSHHGHAHAHAAAPAHHSGHGSSRRVASTLRREPPRQGSGKARAPAARSGGARAAPANRPPIAGPARRNAGPTVRLPSMQELDASLRRR